MEYESIQKRKLEHRLKGKIRKEECERCGIFYFIEEGHKCPIKKKNRYYRKK
jgi:hypothetical protein